MSDTITMPQVGLIEIIERTRPERPKKCHTVDARGWALCGAFGPSRDRSLHSRKKCRAQGHRRCVACDELNGQLRDDGLMG